MKLIYCPICHTVFNLTKTKKSCDCGKSFGYYKEDGLNAIIGGIGYPIGFNNFSFHGALNNQPLNGNGKVFEAFVIPMKCKTIKRV